MICHPSGFADIMLFVGDTTVAVVQCNTNCGWDLITKYDSSFLNSYDGPLKINVSR